ncbi:hypothetical protein R6Q57_011189 [Mikania cordata]
MQRWRRHCITIDPFTFDSNSNIDYSFRRRHTPSVGSLAVYVGSECQRFVLLTRFLNLLVFMSLLNKAKEEFGFQTSGGLIIPCDVMFFK